MADLVADNNRDATNLLMVQIQKQHLEKEAINARKQLFTKNVEQLRNQQQEMEPLISKYQQKNVALAKENAVLQSALDSYSLAHST